MGRNLVPKKIVYLPCFYCQVDSWEMRYFLIGLLALSVLGTLFVTLSAHVKGHFKNLEKTKYQVLEVELDDQRK